MTGADDDAEARPPARKLLGQRQQQIIDFQEAGSFSFEALVRRISPDRAEDRRLITASLRRLADAGLIRVEGRRRGRGTT
jgi:hypothetical protein